MIELIIAFGAGLISFLSPCVLPLIPGYISYISGSSLNELIEKKNIKLSGCKSFLPKMSQRLDKQEKYPGPICGNFGQFFHGPQNAKFKYFCLCSLVVQ